MGLNDGGRYEIDVRLAQKEKQFTEALVLAADVRLEAVADDDLVVGGQGVGVRIIAANRGETAVDFGSTLAGFQPSASGDCAPEPLAAKAARSCRMNGIVALDARLTAAHFKYAKDAARFDLDPDVPPGLPFRPTPFVANVTLRIGGEPVAVPVPVVLALRRQPLQRREARRAARRAEVRGLGHARDPHRADRRARPARG